MPAATKYRRALLWLRRALRVDDNAALWHALLEADEVVPVLVLSEDASYAVDTRRRRFVRRAIADLDAGLRARGSRLHVRIGSPEIELPAAAIGYNADVVYAVRLYDEPARRRDARIATALRRSGKQLILVKDRVLREADEIRTDSGGPYRVFTPYKRRWLEAAADLPRPFPDSRMLATVPMASGSIPLQRIPGFDRPLTDRDDFSPLLRLERFLRGPVDTYDRRRDLPAVDGTSRLSHHLSLGSISPRRVYWAAQELFHKKRGGARAGIETFVSELIWREFYYQILSAFPFVLDTAFREEFRDISWQRSTSAFARWKSGTTGYPIVDAAMRQLDGEGWMHNRARMIVASFLTKDLHLNWQWGERYFAETLIDLDLASNNGGWQWTAGTGTDASPWFRIFNPVLQGKKFDPEGAYVRRYVPELARVPAQFIHEPWRMSQQDQESSGCLLGRQYPKKIVEHAEERLVTHALYSGTSQR